MSYGSTNLQKVLPLSRGVNAALVTMVLAFYSSPSIAESMPAKPDERFWPMRAAICEMLSPNDPPMDLAAAWALAIHQPEADG